ncbi:MAG: DUF445 family protein [Bacillota bacterium]
MGLLNLAFNIIAGAANGYITNDVAVKMLFQKIGPFGGVLEKTREEFIYNLSQLVEREIINHNTLAGEINNDEFKENLTLLIEDMFMEELPKVIKDKKISDVPDFSSTKKGISKLLSKSEMISDLLYRISKNIKLNQLISYNQFNNVLEELLIIIAELTDDPELVDEFIDFLKKLLNDIQVEDQKYLDLIEDFQEELIKNENEIKNYFNLLLKETGIREIIKNRLAEIYNKPLNEIIHNFNKKTDGSDFGIFDNIYEFLTSPAGKELGIEVGSAFINSFKKVRLTLPEIFGETWDKEITPLLVNELPVLIYEFLNWLQNHKGELEELVDETIGEILESNRGLKNNLKQILYKALSGKVASRYGLIGRLLKSFSEDDNLDKIAYELAEKIKEIISKRELGWYISRVDNLELGDAGEWYDKILDILYKWFKNNSNNEKYTSLSLKDILGPAPFQILINEVNNLLTNLTTGFFYGERFKVFLAQILEDKDILKWLKTIIIKIDFKELLKNKDIDNLSLNLYEKIGAYDLGTIISDESYQYLSENISSYLDKEVQSIFDKYSSEEINDILGELNFKNRYSRIADKLASSIIDIVENNLDKLLSGKISQIVSDNLIDLSAEDMRKVVEGFIGKELKPLTYFGGMLGGLAGLILNTFGEGLLSGAGITSILPAMLLFGFVGFITNVIAIWMIFRPYEPVKIGGKRLPFTPGLFARNQERFAETLGDFVQDELLEPYRINRVLKDDRQEYQKLFKENLLENDYRKMRAILKLLSKNISKKLSEVLEDNFENIINDNIELLIHEIDELNFNSEEIYSYLRDIILELINEGLILDSLSKAFEDLSNNNNKLSLYFDVNSLKQIINILTEYIFDQLYEIVEAENQGLEKNYFGEGFNIEELIKDYFSNKRLKDIFPLSTRRSLNNFITDYVLNIIRSGGLIKLLTSYKVTKDSSENSQRAFKLSLDKFLIDEYNSIQIFMIEKSIALIKSYRGKLKEFAAEILEEELIADDENGGWLSQALFKSAYRFTGSRETVAELVDVLIDKKLPYFIYEHQKELENNFKPLVFNGINRIAKNFWEVTDRNDWQVLIDRLFIRPELADAITLYTREFIINCWNIKIPEIKLDLDGSRNNYINSFKSEVIFNIIENKQEVKSDLVNILEIIFASILDSQDINGIFKFITGMNSLNKEEFKGRLKPIINYRYEEVISILDNLTQKLSKIKKIQEPRRLFKKDILAEDIIIFSKNISASTKFKQAVTESFEIYISRKAGHLNQYISTKTINYLSDYFIEAGFNSLDNHFQALLKSIAIKDITVNQVQLMEAEAIEDLFNSFAGSYLMRLKMYGWSGSVFGLLTGLITGF